MPYTVYHEHAPKQNQIEVVTRWLQIGRINSKQVVEVKSSHCIRQTVEVSVDVVKSRYVPASDHYRAFSHDGSRGKNGTAKILAI